MPAIDVFWLNHSMALSPIGAPHLAASHASNTFTISPISQSRSVTLAAIAGVVRSVLWIRTVAQDRGDVCAGSCSVQLLHCPNAIQSNPPRLRSRFGGGV